MNTFDQKSTMQISQLSSRKLPNDAMARFGFFGLLRWISANYTENAVIGEAVLPQHESFRLGQKPSLTFAPRELADIATRDDGRLIVRLFGLGLLGPNGAMPLQFTDFVRERIETKQDSTLADFLDIFHHRYLTQLYRAWAQAQSTVGLDRPDDERFSKYIDALGKVPSNKNSVLPAHARLAASAHLVREARAPEALANTLEHFFSTTVKIEEYRRRWIDIAYDDISKIGKPGFPSSLGEGAFAGEKILDCQHNFRIVIGPLSLDEYLSFMPGGSNLNKLIEWVRAFVGFEYSWEVEINVNPNTTPPAQLGNQCRLGWTSWLGKPGQTQDYSRFVFEPEEAIKLLNKKGH
jgi:type VI secretion system protein ImpH